jgi:hypothetical protein
MSQQTMDAVEKAIAEHLADANEGAYLTGYLLIATGVSPKDEGGTRYSVLEPEDQPVHVSLGLASYLGMLIDNKGIGDDV